MSRDVVNPKDKSKKDMTWSELIAHSESEISACHHRINALRKSLNFFRQQAESGVPFPSTKKNRHTELS